MSDFLGTAVTPLGLNNFLVFFWGVLGLPPPPASRFLRGHLDRQATWCFVDLAALPLVT